MLYDVEVWRSRGGGGFATDMTTNNRDRAIDRVRELLRRGDWARGLDATGRPVDEHDHDAVHAP